MRTLITCGGTGGHIFPAIALAEELKKNGHADSVFVIDKSYNTQAAIRKAGFSYHVIDVPKMPYGITLEWLGFLKKLVGSRFNAEPVIAEINPDIAVGFGAYISGPVIQAAASMGIKTIIHEQNAAFGRANKLLLNHANRVCLSFSNSLIKKNTKYVFTGNPLRKQIVSGFKMTLKEEALSAFKFSASRKTLLVIGGSAGAHSINKAVSGMVEQLDDCERDCLQVVHITGYKDIEEVEQAYRVGKIVYWVRGFYDKMSLCYKAADLVICRAGAATVSEVALFGIPAIFIPYPWAGSHQNENAVAVSRQGAAVLIEQRDLSSSRLKKEIFSILQDEQSMKQMARNMQQFSQPDASSRLAREVMDIAGVK